MRSLLFILLLTCAGLPAFGKDGFSYLYIQGDKETPFYVKLEDAMQPRYGKNYCILPQLGPGPAHLEILFQQNAFPAQQFTIMIPEAGSRGFLLVKKDGGFSLYDLQQGSYLPAGNAETDDHLPSTNGQIAQTAPAPALEKSALEKPAITGSETTKAPVTANAINNNSGGTSPAFIPDIVLSKGAANVGENTSPATATGGTALPVIANSDCPAPVSTAAFGKIFNTYSGHKTDEERLDYAMTQLDVCYETWQTRAMAQVLSEDVSRYTLLKKMYPRITDQGAFPLLDDLLTTETWKAEFAKLLHH